MFNYFLIIFHYLYESIIHTCFFYNYFIHIVFCLHLNLTLLIQLLWYNIKGIYLYIFNRKFIILFLHLSIYEQIVLFFLWVAYILYIEYIAFIFKYSIALVGKVRVEVGEGRKVYWNEDWIWWGRIGRKY